MMIETHRSFVNTWECDENDHMNVQFYFKRFAEAGEVFAALHGRDRATGHLPRSRHVKFLKELRFNASTATRSAVIKDGPCVGAIVHLMEDAISGELAATAIDETDENSDNLPSVASQLVEMALPRGIDFGSADPEPEDVLKNNGAITTLFRSVMPADCDVNGKLTAQQHISHFTDGAPGIWEATGLTTNWLNENQFGRVAVEMKLSPIAPIRAGMMTRQMSHVPKVGEKTFSIRHQINDMQTGEPLAVGEVVGLVMDLAKRRAVAMPDFIKRRS